MDAAHYPGGVWLIDFEFHPAHGREGNPPVPVCMVAHELISGRAIRLWKDQLEKLRKPPFPTDKSSLIVAYYASAEMGCFLALGWPFPSNIVDLYVEFRNLTNGRPTPSGDGLLGAIVWFGLHGMSADRKETTRKLILAGGPWSNEEREDILRYCEDDVLALRDLLPKMWGGIDWPRALLRGSYTAAVAEIETNGSPIDTETLEALVVSWPEIKRGLIEAVDSRYCVYEDGVFKISRFERLLANLGIVWRRLPGGQLNLQDDTFKEMALAHPELGELRELRKTLSQMRQLSLAVGDDGRNRCLLSMFRSKTGRNQPSGTKFIFGLASWARGLIKPPLGYGCAYIDWSQQEFGIAAALSRDEWMMEAYRSGDPYLAFAKQAGAVPPDATKQSHPSEREQYKMCVLAVLYGMGAETFAFRIGQPVARARQLLDMHRRTYRRFWAWSDGVSNHALLKGELWTQFGWYLHVGDMPNDRSLRNFPVQGSGADMLRLTCIRLVADGVRVCAPVHDAVLIEAPLAELDAVVVHTQAVMRAASAAVLGGFELESDAQIVRYPDRYMDKRGANMWNAVMAQLELYRSRIPAQGCAAS